MAAVQGLQGTRLSESSRLQVRCLDRLTGIDDLDARDQPVHVEEPSAQPHAECFLITPFGQRKRGSSDTNPEPHLRPRAWLPTRSAVPGGSGSVSVSIAPGAISSQASLTSSTEDALLTRLRCLGSRSRVLSQRSCAGKGARVLGRRELEYKMHASDPSQR